MRKMSVLRRTLAWILLLCMFLGLMPGSVFATHEGDEPKTETKAATNYQGQIDSLATPYNEAISAPNNKYSEVFSNNGLGYYYIVNKKNNTTGRLLSMSEMNYDQYIPSTGVTISGTKLLNPDPNNAIYIKATAEYRGSLYPYKGNTLTLYLEGGDFSYLFTERGLLAENKMGGRVKNGMWVFPVFMGNVGIPGDTDAWFTLTYEEAEDAFAFKYHGTNHDAFQSTQTMQLYRVYMQGVELYKAIKAVRGYADGNADGRYPADLYTTFSTYLENCISTYNSNNIKTTNEESLKTTLDAMAKQLIVYADDLSANATDLDSYIDIPVEILDFRADGMMIEWDRATEPKWNLRSDTSETGAKYVTVKFPEGAGSTVITGLTESKLINNQMIYTEKVVGYVAGFLSTGYATDWSANTKIPGYNNIPYEMMGSLSKMGSFKETIAKTDTKSNGGYLEWSQVTTYYDMAYYILNNLWRPVKTTDYMDTSKNLGYNTVVSERKRLRLFKDETTGYYTIDATNRMINNGYYIFNASEEYPTDAMYGDPFFRPIDNMGFESPEMLQLVGGDTDQGDYLTKYQHESKDMNYHFSLHAEGSFVYYRDQNQYFQFVGDDDVYFYINDRIAMDLGASHGALGDELYLNTIADEFGLEDGGVYSFDMFYIERHATASNLKFSTNIKIVETETMTTKGMYLESSKGVSKVDSATGMGEALADNSLLRTGDVVAYSFNIANSRDIPVYNLSFVDNTMGTSLASNAVYLCNTNLTGGLNTAIGDIKVYYRTMDSGGNINSAVPTSKTYSQITTMINTANSKQTSLAEGSYVVSPESVTNLMALLNLGIPANCQIMIYGFKRQAQESVPSYENTLSSVCYYNLEGTGQTTPGVEEIPIKGTASRIYKVTAEPPTSQKQEIVLDYGKAVEIPTDIIGGNIQTDALTTVTGFAGIVTSGNHEQVLTYISPSNLKCSSVGQTYVGVQGTFTRTNLGLDYKPTEFMETIETVYLVYNISATNSNYKYVLVELKILPATFVYYESDFASGVIKTEEKSPNLFIDFSNTEADRERYSSNYSYCGNSFDVLSSWRTNANASSFKVDNKTGTLSMTAVSSLGSTKWPDVILYANAPVDFSLANAEIYQVRFKTENFVKGTQYLEDTGNTKNISPYFNFRVKTATTDYTNALVKNDTSFASYMSTGDYITMTVELNTEVKAFEDITSFYCYFGGIESDPNATPGVLTIDYIYVGTKADAPARDSLYFDFTDTESAQERYEERPYGDYNYDTQGWGSRGDNMNAVSYDNTNGTISATSNGGTAAMNPNTYYLQMAGLNYDPSNAEVFKARVKLENFVAVGAAEVYVDFIDQNGTIIKQCGGYTIDTTDLTNGNWFTVSVPVTAAQTCDNIGYVRLNIRNVTNGSENGKITLDYLYVGPEEDAPAGDYLYFDFKDSDLARERYQSPIYNATNFNDPAKVGTNWKSYSPSLSQTININDGVMEIVGKEISEDGWPGYYTTIKKPVNFPTKNADLFAIRFKLENFVIGTQNSSIKDPYFSLGAYEHISDSEHKSIFKDYKYGTAHIADGTWITIEQDVSNATDFHAFTSIESLRIYFGGIESDLSKFDDLGKITVDYVYLGSKEDYEKVKAANEGAWCTVTDSTSATDDYQDQIDIVPTDVTRPITEISTNASEAEVLEYLGVANTLSANEAQRNEYFGLTNGKENYLNGVPSTISHRGSFRTSSENSYIGVMDALMLGIDNVEIDLQITSDGVVVLCHDEKVDRIMGPNKGKVADLAWNTIKDYPLEAANGSSDSLYYTLTAEDAALLNSIPSYKTYYGEAATVGGNHYTARFDLLLELLKAKAPNAMLTLDKVNTQERFVAIYKLLKEKNMLGHAMFSLNTTALNTIDTWADAAANACGISKQNVLDTILVRYSVGLTTGTVANMQKQLKKGSFLKVVEYTYDEAGAAQAEAYLTSTLIPFLKENNIGFYPSAIGPGWAGGRDDVETTWLHFLNMGADAIMTDRAEELAGFMHYYNGAVRTTSELIEAEQFQNYNVDSAKFYMKEAANLNNNKQVSEMHDEDWLQYNNIKFTGSETVLYVSARGHEGGTLKFYVDAIKEENLFAVANIAGTDLTYTQTVTMLKKISSGTHTVYVKAEGMKGQALVSFDAFSFKNFANSNYLFFGFGNDGADRARYENNGAYGGFNFDDQSKAYWGTNSTTGNNSTSQNQFKIDNQKGVVVINVGTASNGTDTDGTTPTYGPEFMTSNTSGVFPWRDRLSYAPLSYTPSKSDFITVRFKISGCVDTGMNHIIPEFWYTGLDGTSTISYYKDQYQQIKADYAFVQDEYMTVTIALPDIYQKAAQIHSLGLRFVGLKPAKSDGTGGTITIDYIYVGPMPDQQTDHLLLSFDGNAEDYSDPIYGGKNFDLASSWEYNNNRSTAPVISDGALKYSIKSSCGVTYHRVMSDITMRYTPGVDEYIQVRLRTENAVAVSDKTPTLNVYWSNDLYSRTNYGLGSSNNTSAAVNLSTSDWQTITIRMDTATNGAYYRDAEVIGAICLMFNNVAVPAAGAAAPTFYIDYVYFGPLEDAPSEKVESSGSLFFDFTNTPMDQDRYKAEQYGGYNFDQDGSAGYWATYTTDNGHVNDQKNYVIDNTEGVAIISVGEANEGTSTTYGPKFQTTNRYGYYPWNSLERHGYAPLHYKPTGEEYIQVRFKIEDCQKVGTLKFQLDYHVDPPFITNQSDGTLKTNYMEYYGLNKTFTYTDGEWVTLTYSLAGVARFQNAEEIQSIGLRFVGIKGKNANTLGRVVIDYIYVGPEEGLPSVDRDTYGYDSSYIDDSLLSNGSSLFVQGKGIPNVVKDKNGNPTHIDYAAAGEYTEVSFTFTGTGFDLISRTGPEQGLIRAVIFDSSGTIVKNVSVINKGESELYQIPVLSVENLTHGTYTVKIFVDEAFDYGNNGNADIFGGAMDRGGEFYFDAIRIYHPINTQAADAVSTYAYEVYQNHGEADPTITEVRNILIDANSFTSGASAVNGVVYLDATAMPGTNFDNDNGKLSAAIAEYKAIGPNNEVYLLPGKAIAFKLEVDGPVPASIDIGAKSANGENVTMSVGISKNVPATLSSDFSRDIQTSTAQYYPLEILPSKLKTTTANSVDTHSVYITVCHTGKTGVLSLTDIKYAYDIPNPDEPVTRKSVRFVIDTQMMALYSANCDHVWDQGEITTAPTCTAEGEKTFTCSLCGVSYTETVSAAEHSYIGGVCICGQTEDKAPVFQASWTINHTLNLASDISVNLVVPKTLLADFDMDTVYMVAEVDAYAGNVKTGTDTVMLQPVDQGNYYYFTLTGLTAVKMNDRIRSVLYGSKDGQLYYSATDDYSVADYAYSQLKKSGGSAKLKTLCADLLRYGTWTQLYKEYRTDALADSGMTDTQRAYLSDMETVAFGNTNLNLEDLDNAPILWAGKSLNLDSKVELKFIFDATNYTGSLDDLTLRVSYTDAKGNLKTAMVANWAVYDQNRGYYSFTLDTLLAAELRSVVSAQVYAGDTPVSATLQYSADTYGNNKTGTLRDLCKALFAYSDSAKNYFNG